MAFSFSNIVNKIKQQFTPKTFFNVETGEIIKSKEYKKLSEEDKKLFISESKLPTGKATEPTLETSGSKTKASEEVHRKTPSIEDMSSPRVSIFKRPKKHRGGDGRKKKEKAQARIEQKEKKQKKIEKKKAKTYKEIAPPKPPKKIVRELETKLKETPQLIDSIEMLRRQLLDLERKAYPMFDLSMAKGYLTSILDENEAYYEGTSTYVNYILEHEEEISMLLTNIEYDSTQQKVDTAVTELASLLNMGTLSSLQQDTLDHVHDSYGWDENG